MLYRAAAFIIVVFWLTMTALLVRQEFASGATALREVPVAHVLKLMFLHQQPSTLHIQHERQNIGHLQLHPQVRAEDGVRLLEFSGNLQVVAPGLARQRAAWQGSLEMDAAMAVDKARLSLTLRDVTAYSVDLLVEPRARRLRYETRAGERMLDRGEYSLDEDGALSWLRDRGIDPVMLKRLHRPDGPQPSIKAWRSSISIRGHKLETYRVAIEHGGQTLAEFQVDHLGHLLQAKTFLGYSASAPEDLVP